MNNKKLYYVYLVIFAAYFVFLLCRLFSVIVINQVFDLDAVVITSLKLLGLIVLGLVISFVLFNLVDFIISLTVFKNNCVTFLNVCYNKKFYVDNSLENILIGKNGPRIYPDKNNNFTFSDIYKFKKIKFSILIAAVVIISAVYFYLDSYFLLIFLMGMNLYSIMILLVHLKYNEFDLYNEVLTLCIYQNVLNYDFIDALKDVDSFDVNVEMEMELHLKLQILMINNNIQHHLSVSDLGVIADKNFFSLLFLEVLENIYNIKNGKPIEYRYSAYYLEMPFIEEMFIDARKMSYEHDLCGLVNLLPYRLRKMLICV